jgi:bis(5'-nucleosidyl)-tetraphosphatase
MVKEICFGIIPLRQNLGGWQVFLVKHKKGDYWSFPKGHHHPNEDAMQTAKRELFEETNLQVLHWLPVKQLTERYYFQRESQQIDKTVTYFIAEVGGEFKPQKVEIEEGNWFVLEEAIDRITFNESRHLCMELQFLLERRGR